MNERCLVKEDLELLLGAVPGPAVIYRVCGEDIRFEGCTHGVSALHGQELAVYAAQAREDAALYVDADDRPFWREAILFCARRGGERESLVRISGAKGRLLWVQSRLRRIGSIEGDPAVMAILTSARAEEELFDVIVGQSDRRVIVCDLNTRETLYYNGVGIGSEGLRASYDHTPCYRFFHGSDRPCADCQLDMLRRKGSMSIDQRLGNGCWGRTAMRRVAWGGRELAILSTEDVTERHKLQVHLEEAHREQTIIMESIPDGVGVFRFDPAERSWQAVTANDALRRMLGTTAQEMERDIHWLFRSRIAVEDHAAFEDCVRQVATRARENASLTCRMYHENRGEERWTCITLSGVSGEDGAVTVYACFTDVHELKTAEDVLAAQSTELETLIGVVPGGIFTYAADETMKFSFISTSLLKMLGMDRAAFDAKFHERFDEMVYAEDRAETLASIDEQISHGNDDYCEYRIEKADGQLMWVFDSGRLVVDAKGRRWFYVVVVDITQRKKLEKALQESGRRLTLAARGAHLDVWEYDMKTRQMIAGSENVQHSDPEIVRDAPESLLSSGFVRPESEDTLREMFTRLSAGQAEVQGDIAIQDENGERRWKHVVYSLEKDAEGRPDRAYGVGQDVTERKQAEEEYARTMQDLPAIDPDVAACVKVDLTANTCQWLGGSDKLMEPVKAGATPQEALTSFLTCLTDPAQRLNAQLKIRRERMQRQLDRGKTVEPMTFRCRFKNGSSGWMTLYTRLARNPHTGRGEALLYAVDVTERYVEERLVHAVVRQDYDCIALIDVAKRSIHFHVVKAEVRDLVLPASEDYDTASVEAIRRTVVPEEQEEKLREAALDHVLEELREKPFYISSSTRRKKDGTLCNKRNAYAWLDEDHSILVLTMTDVTDVVQREQTYLRQVEAALAQAKEANAAKSDFLSRMSHEIRTPMNAIIGLTALARDNAAEAPGVMSDLDKIDASSRFLLSLINDVLDMSRIEQGKLELHPERVTLAAIDEFIETIVEPVCATRGVRFSYRGPETETAVTLDRLRFQQMVLNLVSNAAKFTGEGGQVAVTLCCLETADPAERELVCTVRDDGVGMSGAFLEKVFEPFTQENTVPSAQAQGTGLGLPISRSIARAMGGDLTLESARGKGTTATICVRVPMAQADKEMAVAADSTHQDAMLAGAHVLLAEDHPLNTEIACRLLAKKGVQVTCAENGQVALDTFREAAPGTFGAILMDIRMPVMDGLTAAKAIRTLGTPDAKTIPIIAMTANAFAEDVAASREAGMNAHLAKPVEPAKLYETLAKAMEK